MTNSIFSPPLYEKFTHINTLHRTFEIIISFLLLSLLAYRLFSLNNHGFTWFLAFLFELWFTFTWVLNLITKWTPVEYKTYPEHLTQLVPELPAVDMFLTTADPVLEPPIITVNTVLSLLAVDYPANKLACYVSDDGCSPLTLYSLMEASKFAKVWVPFCKKYNIQVRAPFRYFSSESISPADDNVLGFQNDWTNMKDEYEQLSQKVEEAAQKSVFSGNNLSAEYEAFKNIESRNHPSIVKVIWENKEGLSNGLPHLVYISREKRPNFPHHYKAGAMNVLTIGHGMTGIQGPVYTGTGCFHRRKLIYDLSLNDTNSKGTLTEKALKEHFGNSMEFTKSAAENISGLDRNISHPHDLSSSIEAAYQVSACGYEQDTSWGTKIGWRYGSATEDVLTGMKIQAKGWKSVFLTPDPPGFLGCSAQFGPVSLIQKKRWATGLLEILFSRNSPIFLTLNAKLKLRQCLAYSWILMWALNSIPQLCYAFLPAFCIITNSHFLPKVQEPASYIFVALFFTLNLYDLSLFLHFGLSIRAWWNYLRMAKINATSAMLFGALSVILKLLGLSETVFEITRKEQSTSTDGGNNVDAGRFTFDESPMFLPGTTILLVQFTALVMGLLGLRPPTQGGDGSGLGEVLCSVWVVLCFWPFVKGLFGRGKYGIPLSTKWKSAALAFLFVHLSRRASISE